MTTTFAIETDNLRKVYGEKVAVRGLTLGPNGAGKTTSLKMLLGLAEPTSGTARLLGHPLGDRRARAKAGFLPEHFRFHEWLTGAEFLQLHGRLYGVAESGLPDRLTELLSLTGLTEFRDKQLRTYSKGMLQRIGLAQALLNRPSIVFLDEPTSGLDPAGRRLVRDIIRDLRHAGTTVFLNSHLLSEVEITCDRVAFIKHGEVLRIDDLSKLGAGHTAVRIRAKNFTEEILRGLNQWATDIHSSSDQITLAVQDESLVPEIIHYLAQSGVAIFSIEPQRITLEELFLQVVGTDGGL